MIADDEELLRTGLTKMIERMELPVVVVGTASDGLQALDMIAVHEPHVLLTDIRMPNMDGLELIENLAKNQHHIRTIILSGYDDFDYARKALRSGCSDYLVKPPIFTELSELLHSIYLEFSLELEKLIEESKKNEILHRSQVLLKTDFLRTLLVKKNNVSTKRWIEQGDRLGINLGSDTYAVAILRSEKRFERTQKYSTADWELFKYACLNITGEIVDGALSFYDEQEQLVILLPNRYSFEESCEKLQETRMNLSHYLHLSFSVALSASYPFHAIAEAYVEANRLLSVRLLREKSVLVTSKELIHYVNEDVTHHLKQLGELQDSDSLSEIQMKLNHWLETVKIAAYTPQALEKLKQELRVALLTLTQKPPMKQIEHESGFFSSQWLEQLGHADSYSDQLEPIHQMIEQLARQQKAGPHQNQTVEKATAYIQKYYNRSINLVSISEHVHMNPAYFSVMFKKKSGIGVIEFLTEVRMEKAKKLLVETELKTYQIAELVGYNDPAYFSNIFKRQCGITPHEYRNTAAINVTRNQ
ncbi:DNA-binding response regulator [Paenibacillus nasutitermitis]|uniref:DNA-binding response regulator n=1 Tax=Paenibacillus nasutitermitis TaxID=1652958 RepID=A0A917DVE5_9BACL|nr:DNA-binding response regulator [Paenibacillus nasutitermitis]